LSYDPYLGSKASEAAEECLLVMICTPSRYSIKGQILWGLQKLKTVRSVAEAAGLDVSGFGSFDERYGIALDEVHPTEMITPIGARLGKMGWRKKDDIRESIFNLCMEVCFSVDRRLV